MSRIAVLLSVLSAGNALGSFDPALRLAAFFLALAWILSVVGCAAWVGWSFANERFHVLWPLKILRTTAHVSTTVLFIPLTSLMMSVYRCRGGETWPGTDWECWGGEHSTMVTIVSIVTLAFAILSGERTLDGVRSAACTPWLGPSNRPAWCYAAAITVKRPLILDDSSPSIAAVVVATFFDRSPFSSNVGARVHGRVQVTVILLKALLTLLYTQSDWVSPWVLIVPSFGAGIAWVAMYWMYLPFYKPWVNCLQTGLGAVHAWASICTIVAQAQSHQQVSNASLAFLMGALFVFFAGWAAADQKWRRFGEGQELSSAFDVELRARFLLQRLGANGSAGAHHSNRGMLTGQKTSSRKRGKGGSGSKSGSGSGGKDDDDDEGSIETVREVDNLFAQSVEFFPQSSILHLFIAHYLSTYKGNRHLEINHLASAESKSPAMDEAFIIYSRRKQLQEADDSSGAAKMNVITRVRFEKYRGEAQESELRARRHQVEFWAELLNKHPDIGVLNRVGAEIAESVAKSETSFMQLLRINSRSVMVLRSYARFLLEVNNNPGKANKLLEEAETIEVRIESPCPA